MNTSGMSEKKNRLTQVLWLILIVISSLFILSFLPEFTLGPLQFKKIDLLSDVHPDPPLEKIVPIDHGSIEPVPIAESPSADTLMTLIEDFSGKENIMSHFYQALQQTTRSRVHIAFYGDSFIEGDIISASLRDTLQRVYGGEGVGLVPMASETAGFRKSIKHTYAHWEMSSFLTAQDVTIPIGISGFTYLPKKDNRVIYKPGKVPPQKNFRTIKVLYQNKGSASIHYAINDGTELTIPLDRSDSLQQYLIRHENIQSIQLRFQPEDSIFVFGANVEHGPGVYVDNFSMRRNSGIALAKLSPMLLRQFNHYLNYKLIILQYGLNVASVNDSTNYGWYTAKMIKIIKNLKEIFPQTSILLLSVSDRGANHNGKIVTMEGIPKMRDMQREIARKSGIAFWDMFEAMGGQHSIASYTEAEPPLAAKDYTHLNHLGGNIIGRKLADALLHEMNKHEKNTNTP